MTGFQPLDEEIVFEGWILRVAKGRFRGPDGTEFERDIVHHPGAVAAVPLIDDDVVLVRQYRAALNQMMLEIPAGLRDVEGEPEEQTARRELIEETGFAADEMERLTTIHNSVGFCDESITIFIATGLTPVERAFTDSPEEQAMEILRVPLTEAEAMIQRGDITDAKTVIGVFAALRR